MKLSNVISYTLILGNIFIFIWFTFIRHCFTKKILLKTTPLYVKNCKMRVMSTLAYNFFITKRLTYLVKIQSLGFVQKCFVGTDKATKIAAELAKNELPTVKETTSAKSMPQSLMQEFPPEDTFVPTNNPSKPGVEQYAIARTTTTTPQNTQLTQESKSAQTDMKTKLETMHTHQTQAANKIAQQSQSPSQPSSQSPFQSQSQPQPQPQPQPVPTLVQSLDNKKYQGLMAGVTASREANSAKQEQEESIRKQSEDELKQKEQEAKMKRIENRDDQVTHKQKMEKVFEEMEKRKAQQELEEQKRVADDLKKKEEETERTRIETEHKFLLEHEKDIKDLQEKTLKILLEKEEQETQQKEHEDDKTQKDEQHMEEIKNEKVSDIFEIDAEAINDPIGPSIIPSAPALSEQMRNKSVLHETLKEELEKACKEREDRSAEIQEKIKLLEKQGFYDPDRNVLKGKFFNYYEKTKIPNETVKIANITENIENIQFAMGLLAIHDVQDDTIFLTGTQSHVVVIYITVDNQKIVTGYLTSEKNQKHIKLSDTQPFSRDDGLPSKNPQLYKPINPLVIKDSDLEALPEETQKAGELYMQNKDIQNTIRQAIIERTNPKLAQPIPVYDGHGITLQDIKNIFEEQEKDFEMKAKKHFKDYIMLTNQLEYETRNKQLQNLKATNPILYDKVKKLIDEHNKKYEQN